MAIIVALPFEARSTIFEQSLGYRELGICKGEQQGCSPTVGPFANGRAAFPQHPLHSHGITIVDGTSKLRAHPSAHLDSAATKMKPL
jgi:hypothetical protein